MLRRKRDATVVEQTVIEDRRRRLEERIKTFHKKADVLMVGADLDDVAPTVGNESGPLHEWDEDEWEGMGRGDGEDGAKEAEVDEEVISGDSGCESSSNNEDIRGDRTEDEDEEDDDIAHPEKSSLCMPSTLGKRIIDRCGLEMLARQEMGLRVGQVNDSLADLRVELGHKSLLFRTKLRHTKNTKGKTRAWKDISKSSMEVMKHVRRYERGRRALVMLGAEEAILQKYQDIKKEHLKMSADILEENRFGQKNASLAWFWRLGPQGDTVGNEWMEECESFHMIVMTFGLIKMVVYRVNWLRSKARYDRWKEEVRILKSEMQWTILFFDHQRKEWEELASGSERSDGEKAYGLRQAAMWDNFAKEGRRVFEKYI